MAFESSAADDSKNKKNTINDCPLCIEIMIQNFR